jgi:hypothetical protein
MTTDFTTPLVFAAHGTADQALSGQKTVTRRLARRAGEPCRWRTGALSRIYRRSPRAQGRPIGEVRIVSVQLERLDDISLEEVAREGFAGMSVGDFLALFKQLHGEHAGAWLVWRIEFARESVYAGVRT